MADTKNFGLSGVGPDLQLGKAGPRLKVNGSVVEARSADGISLTTIRAAAAVANTDVVTLSQLNALDSSLSNSISNAGVADGFHLILGDIVAYGDGSWSPGAVPLTNSTVVSEAVDQLNEILGKLVPNAPPNFPNANALTVASVGSSPVLASGAQDNASTGTTAGTAVTRITSTTLASSNSFTNMGPGESGTLSLLVNNSSVGSHTLTGIADNGTYGGLVISGQADYPVATPGFWKSVNVSVSGAATQLGVNNAKITDTAAGSTNLVTFVRDNLVATPAITSPTVAQLSNGTVAFSSSVPHYNTGATLTVGGSISNLAGQTYFNGSPLSIGATNSILSTQTFTYANVGISTPIAANTTTATAMSTVTLSVNPSNVHNSGTISLAGTNVNGQGGTASPSSVILVKNGTTTRVDELSVPVTGLGSSPSNSNAVRVGQATGNTPVLAANTWVQSASIHTWDATVVGGALKNDTTNYSTGFLPAGPNLSGQDAAQYVTFSFNRTALSQFKITVTGTYAGVWIGLPGVSDNSGVSPNAVGGAWWNAFVAYAGAGVPGGAGELTAGCASGAVMNGSSGTFQMTFGTASSTSATGNQILVRIRLNAGQSITALSFTN
jgi:hypothetical protein